MGHIVGTDRNQLAIRSLDEMVAIDSPVRQIDKMIGESDTSYFEKAETKATGRPPFDPKDMLKLYVYGMDNGIVSSRKLDRECKRNVEVMWLLNGLQPDDKTICNFRRENAEKLARFFNEFCRTLAKKGYIDGGILAVDGTKIRANNSRHNNFSASKLNKRIALLDKRIAEYLTEVDKNDKIEELKKRKAKYELFRESISSGKVNEVSVTDPDSRLMKQTNYGMDVSYNVQTAVDSKHKLVAGVLVLNETNDLGQLSKTAKAVKKNLYLDTTIVIADKGYYMTEDFKTCHENGIDTIVAKPEEKRTDENIVFGKHDDFRYDKGNDCYYCPANQILKKTSEKYGGLRRYENRSACGKCPLRPHCAKGARRVITRHISIEHAEQNDRNLAANPHIYKLRQELSEHPFGTVKRTMGIRQFLTRGLINVAAEAALIFLCYNLKRLRNIQQDNNNNEGDISQHIQFFAVFCWIFYYLSFQQEYR